MKIGLRKKNCLMKKLNVNVTKGIEVMNIINVALRVVVRCLDIKNMKKTKDILFV